MASAVSMVDKMDLSKNLDPIDNLGRHIDRLLFEKKGIVVSGY